VIDLCVYKDGLDSKMKMKLRVSQRRLQWAIMLDMNQIVRYLQ